MSEAEGVANGTFLPFGSYVWMEKLFETTRLGGVVSGASSKMTVTVNVPVPTFPAASDAVQVTVVVPTEKLEPEDGEQVGPEVTPTSSVTFGFWNVTGIPEVLLVFMVIF